MTNDVTGGNQTAKTMKIFLRGFYEEPPTSFRKPSEILSTEIGTYAKRNFHTLVRYNEFPCGDRERIEYWGKYPIESANFDELYVGDLTIEREKGRKIVRFNKIPEISYQVSIDGKELSDENGVYVIKKSRPKLARLQIVCKSDEKVLYTKGKWIIL